MTDLEPPLTTRSKRNFLAVLAAFPTFPLIGVLFAELGVGLRMPLPQP